MGDINAVLKTVMASDEGWAFIAEAMAAPAAGVTGIAVPTTALANVQARSNIIIVEGMSVTYAGLSTGRTIRCYVTSADGTVDIQHGLTLYVTTDGVDTHDDHALHIPVDLNRTAAPFYLTMGASELGDIAYITAWGTYPLPIPTRETTDPFGAGPLPVQLDGIKSIFRRA